MQGSGDSNHRSVWRHVPVVATAAYLLAFVVALTKKVVWPVGDDTDVIVPGILALPWSLLLASGEISVGRSGAFVVVSAGALINGSLIFLLFRTLMRSRRRFVKPISLTAISVVLVVAAILVANHHHDLRGSWTRSKDGQTYLGIVELCGSCANQVEVDSVVWPHPVGQAGRIEPGSHKIGCCGGEIGFDIRPGVVYRFDYWGP